MRPPRQSEAARDPLRDKVAPLGTREVAHFLIGRNARSRHRSVEHTKARLLAGYREAPVAHQRFHLGVATAKRPVGVGRIDGIAHREQVVDELLR